MGVKPASEEPFAGSVIHEKEPRQHTTGCFTSFQPTVCTGYVDYNGTSVTQLPSPVLLQSATREYTGRT